MKQPKMQSSDIWERGDEMHESSPLTPWAAGFSLDTASAQALNRHCFCLSLDEAALAAALDSDFGQPGLSELVRERCSSAFAARPVFVAAQTRERIESLIEAIERVVALPAYREQALARAPRIAQVDSGARGVFLGYDFHLDGDRLALIEVNTNAGGAMLNAALARAQRACCKPVEPWLPTAGEIDRFEQAIVRMFAQEWQQSGTSRALRTVVIVDEAPNSQYLYPEFLLFQRLLERHGLRVMISDPSALCWRDGQLWAGDTVVDLVYNRLCDFYLEQPGSRAMRQAYEASAVVLTPNPRAHALYADKRNLVVLSDDTTLRHWGIDDPTRQLLLSHVPRTVVVSPANLDALWAERRQWFFKPSGGFGSRAAYRGDKLTRRVWDEICATTRCSDEGQAVRYVAQKLAPPGERHIGPASDEAAMKFDLRAYAYDSQVQWLAARLYRGQTTNFRSPGGGFAPVYSGVAGSE